MAAAVAARDMIDAARRLTGTDSVDPANSFVDDYEALAILNGQLAELYDLILEHGFGDYFRSESPLTLVAGTSRYSLPTDFYEIVGVDINWSSSVVRSAKLFMESERNRYRRILPAWSQFCDVWYRPLGQQVEFIPVPQSGLSVTVLYIPTFTPLADTASTFDSINQWDWFAIWGLAAAIRHKDDDPVGEANAMNQKALVRERIISMAARRVDGEPPRIQRTRSFDDEDIW